MRTVIAIVAASAPPTIQRPGPSSTISRTRRRQLAFCSKGVRARTSVASPVNAVSSGRCSAAPRLSATPSEASSFWARRQAVHEARCEPMATCRSTDSSSSCAADTPDRTVRQWRVVGALIWVTVVSQSVVKVQLHSTGAASRLPALLLGQILPVFSLVALCQTGSSPVSVQRWTFTTDCKLRAQRLARAGQTRLDGGGRHAEREPNLGIPHAVQLAQDDGRPLLEGEPAERPPQPPAQLFLVQRPLGATSIRSAPPVHPARPSPHRARPGPTVFGGATSAGDCVRG